MDETIKWAICMGLFLLLVFFPALWHALLPRIRGHEGEAKVAGILSKLPRKKYQIINNVMLNSRQGLTQIDHIVVSVYGIFVIETKNYSGRISGDEYAWQWCKSVGSQNYFFPNPMKQNYGHVQALRQLLHLPEDVFLPIVVFAGDAKLFVEAEHPVVYARRLRRKIKSCRRRRIPRQEISGIVDKILAANVDSGESRAEHIRQIRVHKKQERKLVRRRICPKCGARLVKCRGKNGVFLGCRNYPVCRYTADY